MMTTEEWNDKTAGEPRADLAQAPAPVRVKPLVWGEKNGAWDARTAFGTGYTVADSQWTYGPPNVWFYSNGGNDAAKAAAQQDYEARILAALEPAPALMAELVEALRLADAAMSGANMNMAVVEKKVKAALAKLGGAVMRVGQQKNGTPGTGVNRYGDQRQFVIKIDNDTAEQVIALARREGTSTAHQIRLLIEWGLEAVE